MIEVLCHPFFLKILGKTPMLTHGLSCTEYVIDDCFKSGSLEEPEMEIPVQRIYWRVFSGEGE